MEITIDDLWPYDRDIYYKNLRAVTSRQKQRELNYMRADIKILRERLIVFKPETVEAIKNILCQ